MFKSPLPRSGPRDYGTRDFAHSPLVVFYETTQACDLVCQHCRACAQTRRHPGELSSDESMLLLEQLSEFRCPPMVVLTGGDPLKRRDIYRLVEHGTECGLSMSITPSATPLVTRDALRRLRDAGIARVAISLDGADATTHDSFRGVVGSFVRTMEILSMAAALRIPVQVNTTITPANCEQVDDLANLLAGQDIVLWSVFFLVPVGRARAVKRLSAEQYEKVFERLWSNAKRQPYMIKTTEAPHYRRFVIQNQLPKRNGQPAADAPPHGFSGLGVSDGKGVMFVGHTGFVYPSGFMPILCGVFPQQHVVDIYQRSGLMRALRDPDRLEGKCRVCEFRHICGGSRARAYAVTGNPFAQEPDCCYQPTVLTGADETVPV